MGAQGAIRCAVEPSFAGRSAILRSGAFFALRSCVSYSVQRRRGAPRLLVGVGTSGAVGLGQAGVLIQEALGILRDALEAHFEVQVRAGRAAGVAAQADQLAALDDLPGLDLELGEVGIARREVVAVVEFDQVAVLGMEARPSTTPPAAARHRRSRLRAEVDAFVHGAHAGNGVDAPAERGAHALGVDRHEVGNRLDLIRRSMSWDSSAVRLSALSSTASARRSISRCNSSAAIGCHGSTSGPPWPSLRFGGLRFVALRARAARSVWRSVAEGVEAHEFGLHFAELDRHGELMFSRTIDFRLDHRHSPGVMATVTVSTTFAGTRQAPEDERKRENHKDRAMAARRDRRDETLKVLAVASRLDTRIICTSLLPCFLQDSPMQKSLEDFLEAPDGAGKVLAHARLLLRLTRLYQTIAPAHLAAASHLANYKSGIVVIHAASGAVATKLKQLAPTLADGFSRKGIECNGVQVKVQARESGTQSRTSVPRPLSLNASRSLGDLRDTLPESPLREALKTLIERAPRE
jgi:hypothetical protein